MIIKIEDIFISNKYGQYTVIDITSGSHAKVKFLNTGYEIIAQKSHIKNLNVKDHLAPIVFGVGFTSGLNTRNKIYNTWMHMLERSYCPKYKSKKPTYLECTSSENFKSFLFFKEWSEQQYGFNLKNWELDKDILIPGNKLYSENTCCFVPREINSLFLNDSTRNTPYPLGVSFAKDRGKYEAYLQKQGQKRPQRLGSFRTVQEAALKYKTEKEKYIKEVAEFWKEKIDPKVYTALINRKIHNDN